MIHSDNQFCIIVPYDEIDEASDELNGSIFYGTKRDFKKTYKKFKTDRLPLEDETKESIVSTFLFDKRRFNNDEKLDELVVLTQHLYSGKP